MSRSPHKSANKPRKGPGRSRRAATGRSAAVAALTRFAERYPDVSITEVDTAGLSEADARLAVTIHRLGVQRWLTLTHLLDRLLKKPVAKLEPTMAAVLVSGAAQLVFMDKVPDYAVVDESARLARSRLRPGAAGLANAVLRRLASMVLGRSDQTWAPAREALPLGGEGTLGGSVKLASAGLPRVDNLVVHLEAAASVPRALLTRWVQLYGLDETQRLALQSLTNPPIFVVEHERARMWEGPHEQLVAWLAEDVTRRVQDPASLASVQAAADLDPGPATVLDLCAGRGTKTRQLRAMFPEAAITAWDPDKQRRAGLPQGVTIAQPAGRYDLVVLDVPCSNTGVLARRPGARYRFTDRHRRDLVDLQHRIIDRGIAHTAPAGHLLYCTCSIDPEENGHQARYLAKQCGGSVVREHRLLPGGAGGDYHDGSYHALVKLPA